MIYGFKVGGVTLLSSMAQIVVVDKGKMLMRDGTPLDISPGIAPRKTGKKPGRKAKKPGKKREVKASCPKCGRVFFQNQGVKQHIKHCKGEGK